MKFHRLGLLTVCLVLFNAALPSTAGAQFIRSPHSSDMRARMAAEAQARAAAQAEAQARAEAQRADEVRQATIVHELKCLENTTQVLQQSFAAHLRTRRSASPQEAELARALTDLLTDVNHLSDDVYGRCGKCGRGDYPHVYRTFHLMEYAAEDAQTLASEAGYGRSLRNYFEDIEQHMGVLAGTGLRNPRLQRIKMDDHFHGRSWTRNEQPIVMPAVPVYPSQQSVEHRHEGPNPAGAVSNEKTIKLGDLLGRIFGKR
ncbi:MAG: hypothetical protein R3F13_10385 [Prosthecobacter sp.]